MTTRRMIHHRDCKAGRGGGECSCWNQEAPVRKLAPIGKEHNKGCGAIIDPIMFACTCWVSDRLAPVQPPPAVAPTPRQYEAANCPLSAREVQVLQAMADHATKDEAGQALCLEENTIKSHLQRVYRKLRVSTAHQAVARGFREGWIK